MPTPNEGESQDDFIERCIPIVIEDGTAEDSEQAYAICLSMFEGERSMNYLRAFRQEVEENTEAGSPIRFVASSEGIKRDGIELKADDWRLDNYHNNPVVLWIHGYFSELPPIGKADAKIEDKQLIADVTFDQEDEFARQIESKYRRGFLNAVSVGWDDFKEDNRVFHDLMDISAVPVPADPDALKMHSMRGVQNFQRWIEEIDQAPILDLSKVDIWEGVSTAMVGLFSQESAIEDETRHGLYIALERAYRKLGKVPPEFRTHDELTALSDTELRGLFLNDELVRAGAVLSARNRNNLEQAQALIQQVLDSAQKEETEPERNANYVDIEQLKALHDILYRSD